MDTYEPEDTPPCNGNGNCESGEAIYCSDCLYTYPGGCRLTIEDGGFIINNSSVGIANSCSPHYLYFNRDHCARYFPLVKHSYKCGLFNLFNCYSIKPGFDITIYDCDENFNCTNGTTKSFWVDYGHYSTQSADKIDLFEVGKTLNPGYHYAVKISGTYNQSTLYFANDYQESIRYIYIIPDIDDLSITSATRGISRNQNIVARKTITISDFVANNDFVFTAGQLIIMKPGTIIQNGYDFSAKINPNYIDACITTTKSAVVINNVQTTKVNGTSFLNINNNEINNKTNIKDIEDSQVKKSINVYPNPSSSVLNFSISENQLVHRIEIYNINGAKVKEIECIDSDLLTIDISSLNSGLYFIQIITDSGLIVKQFIKQ